MSSNLDQIRDQQRDTWDRFSAGWKKWDELVLGWLAPFGAAMIRHADLNESSQVLDVAAGTYSGGAGPPQQRDRHGPLRTHAGGGSRERGSPRYPQLQDRGL